MSDPNWSPSTLDEAAAAMTGDDVARWRNSWCAECVHFGADKCTLGLAVRFVAPRWTDEDVAVSWGWTHEAMRCDEQEVSDEDRP